MDARAQSLHELGARGLTPLDTVFITEEKLVRWQSGLRMKDPAATQETVRRQTLNLVYMKASIIWAYGMAVFGWAGGIVGPVMGLGVPGVLLGSIAGFACLAAFFRIGQGYSAYPHNVRFPQPNETLPPNSIWNPPASRRDVGEPNADEHD